MSQIQEDCSVYVGNLDVKVTLADMEELVYELFLQAGPIDKIYLPSDRTTGMHKTFGFVQYEHKESVAYAISLFSGICLSGRPLKVRASSKCEQAPAATAENTPNSPTQVTDDTNIEAKLHEQFGSRLSPPPPPTLESPVIESAAMEVHQQGSDTPPPLMSNSAGNDFKTPSHMPIASLPPLTPFLPPQSLPGLFPSVLPLPPPGLPPPPPGLPPPGLPPPLPPTISSSLFQSILPGVQAFPAASIQPPSSGYGYEQLPPPVSLPSVSLLEQLSAAQATTITSACQPGEDHQNRNNFAEGGNDECGEYSNPSPYGTNEDTAYSMHNNSMYHQGQEDSSFPYYSHGHSKQSNYKKKKWNRNTGRHKKNGTKYSEAKMNFIENSVFSDLSHTRLHCDRLEHVDDKPSWMSQDTRNGIQAYHLNQLKTV